MLIDKDFSLKNKSDFDSNNNFYKFIDIQLFINNLLNFPNKYI